MDESDDETLDVTLTIDKIRQSTQLWVKYDWPQRDGCLMRLSVEYAINVTYGGKQLYYPGLKRPKKS